MTVYLIALGGDRVELYSEPADQAPYWTAPPEGRLKRWAHRAIVRWRELVDAARLGTAEGRMAKWRDAMICRLAESIAEQRTMWALRTTSHSTLQHPASMTAAAARRALDRYLMGRLRHHALWLGLDTLLLVASGVLFFVPGPNLIGYYLAFRVFGHAQSCLGAWCGARRVVWTLSPDTTLDELAALAHVPHAVRADRVIALADHLSLHHFAAYFERVAR